VGYHHRWCVIPRVFFEVAALAYLHLTPLDYAVYIRETTKPWKVFIWTWSGLFFSQFLIEALGAALMTSISGSDAFTAAYKARGVGGLTGQIFEGYGTGVRNFGKFIEAILSFSVVAVVITNIYSLGLNVQIVSNYLILVPRLIWSAIAGVIFLVSSFAPTFSNACTIKTVILGAPLILCIKGCRNCRPQPPSSSHGRLLERNRLLAHSIPRHHAPRALVLPTRLRLRHHRMG
jgi:hypothetical protein